MVLRKFSSGAGRLYQRLYLPCHQNPTLDGLAYWRERILHSVLAVGGGLSLFALAPALYMALSEGLWLLFGVDICAFMACASLLMLRRTEREIRAAAVLLITFLVGVFVIGQAGFLSGGPAWLFCFTILSGLLLGLRAALLATLLNAAALVALAALAGDEGVAQAAATMSLSRAVAAIGNFRNLDLSRNYGSASRAANRIEFS